MYGRSCTYGGRKVVAGSDYLWDLQDLRDLINMDDLKDLEDFSPMATDWGRATNLIERRGDTEYQAVVTLGFDQPPPKPCTARRNVVPLQPQTWAELSRSLTNSAPSVPSLPDRIEQQDCRSALPLATAGTQEIQLNRSAAQPATV